jgi:FkbM family methyltransferase
MAVTFSQWIDRQRWFHALVRVLRLRALVSFFLRIWPLSRTFSSGARVEVTDLESFYLSDEIFQRETYRRALSLAGEVRTIADIGCNIGFFCCYLRAYFGRNNFSGIGIDANPVVLKQAQRNLQLNGLQGIRLIHGLAGGTVENSTQDFYLYASHLGSSQFMRPETGRTLKGDWTKVVVPALKPSDVWRNEYGDTWIDLLKIDIEGSEGKLLSTDPALFRQTKCLVVEWHKWLVKEEELFPVLHELGFTHCEALETGKTAELWFFSRKSPT